MIARIEPGDGTPAFKFPTIEPPSANDYADASQGHAHIRVLRGRPRATPPQRPRGGALGREGAIQGRFARESFFFDDNTSGMILLDLGQTIPVKKVNTYSWHQCHFLPATARGRRRSTISTARRGATPPGADGNLAAAGWTLIAQVNTDEFFGFPRAAARPAQQAVSITASRRRPDRQVSLFALGRSTDPLEAGARTASDNTFYGEFDVYRAEED